MVKKDEVPFLMQLVEALDEGGEKLEHFYDKNDIQNFNKAKRFILQIQRKISEVLK